MKDELNHTAFNYFHISSFVFFVLTLLHSFILQFLNQRFESYIFSLFFSIIAFLTFLQSNEQLRLLQL